MGQIGVMFRPEWPPEELPRFAREAERDGFDELWLVEDCFLVGGLTMAATGLALTDSLRVGIGLLPAAMRNPALAAMEIAGLGRLHPGRLAVAFGHGVEPWMRQIDARPPDRLAALEEVVSAVRALLTRHERERRRIVRAPARRRIASPARSAARDPDRHHWPARAGGGRPVGGRLPARRGQRPACRRVGAGAGGWRGGDRGVRVAQR